MPILRRKRDGNYYIVGPPHGGARAICVWQVGPEALLYLRTRGIQDGGNVSYHDLQALNERRRIWTGGSGSGQVDPATWFDADLLDRLADWSTIGGASGLERELSSFERIFPGSFLDWLRTLVDGGRLSEFDGMARDDFRALAGPELGSLKSPLHAASVEYDDVRILWRLAEVVGRVAWHVEAEGTLPPASWATDFRLLARLHERLRVGKPQMRSGGKPRRRASDPRTRPHVWWDADGQRVVAVFPGRLLEAGRSVSWSMPGVDLPQPEAFPVADGVWVEEVQSDALAPAARYAITAVVRPDGAATTEDYLLPPEDRPLVLFSAEGQLVSCAPGESHPPGNFLGLIPRDLVEHLPSRRGVRVVDRIDYEPVLWDGWRGFRLELEDGADVGPYRIAGSGARAWWKPEGPPPHPVVFENQLPVWVGPWPRIEVSQPSYFGEGVIEVELESGGPRRLLRLGEDVPLVLADDRAWLDLQASASLREVFGAIRLACRLAAIPDQTPLTLRLSRVRPLELDYVEDPDPKRRDRVAAVRVRTVQPVAPGAGTRLVTLASDRLALATDPDKASSVRLSLPDSGVELRVRVPRTRLRLLSERTPLDGWKGPGEVKIRLAEIALGDRVRVELHLGAELERGRPLCRLVGGAEIATGEPSRLPGTFDIPLHRWLDRLGPEAAGTVQVRGRLRWIDLVELIGRHGVPEPGPKDGGRISDGLNERERLVHALDLAVAREDLGEAARLVDACLGRVRGSGASAAEREWLRVAVARAAAHLGEEAAALEALDGLHDRSDLYEPLAICRALELRRGDVPRHEISGRGQIVADLPADFALKRVVAAEYCVHCADGPGDRYWDSCRRLLEPIAYPAIPVGRATGWTTDRKEALLLHALATFRVGRVPSVPDGVPSTGQWRWLPALAFAAERVTSRGIRPADGRTVPASDLPRPPLFRERDADLVRVVLLQAAGHPADAAAMLERFRGVTPEEFFALDLLRLRQFRLEGRHTEAKDLYRSCLDWARIHHEGLFGVLMDEFI